MSLYRRILIPIDGSQTAELGLDEAMRLAVCNGARIRLICVVGELPLSSRIGADCYSPKEVRMLSRELGVQVLRNAARRVRARCIPVDSALFEAGEQSFEERVAQEADAWGADLIVVGARGGDGFNAIPRGAGARSARRAAPMLLVHESARKAQRRSVHGGRQAEIASSLAYRVDSF
ncbi:hypothetical protein LMG26684_04621 [Achromobacter mucicolens]|nr:universal stress protein [Achromobacter mucicolens]CAB3901372.1 hypothetical protein LMG26684_04621 [Achromobacter mucicolens]